MKKSSKQATVGGWIALVGGGLTLVAALLGVGDIQQASDQLLQALAGLGLMGAGWVGLIAKGEDE